MSESAQHSPPTGTPLIARASKTVRNKNLILVVLCAIFAGWFAYDGLIGWPARNDRNVTRMRDVLIPNRELDKKYLDVLALWPGWRDASNEQKVEMGAIAKEAGNKIEGWKGDSDLSNQLYITYGLIATTIATIIWFVHCQRRRVIADEQSLSTGPGVTIAWDQIKTVDNTRWNKSGIVDITYADGASERAVKLDDYIVERQPLIEILKMIDARATKAEFLPKAGLEAS